MTGMAKAIGPAVIGGLTVGALGTVGAGLALRSAGVDGPSRAQSDRTYTQADCGGAETAYANWDHVPADRGWIAGMVGGGAVAGALGGLAVALVRKAPLPVAAGGGLIAGGLAGLAGVGILEGLNARTNSSDSQDSGWTCAWW